MSNKTLICLDESGGLRAEVPLIIGAFVTTNERMIRGIIEYSRNLHKYPYELHFNKISSNPNDKRYKTSRTVLKALLSCERDWHVRLIYSNDPAEISEWSNIGIDEFYNQLIEKIINRFGTFSLRKNASLVLDENNKINGCDHVPEKLEIFLNDKVKKKTGTRFTVRTGDSSKNDLLQLADLFCGAIRQLYIPSDNQNKIEIAEAIIPIIYKKNSPIRIVKAS